MERVAIFIDGSNFYHGLRNVVGRTDINFQNLGYLLCAKRELVRIYYYNAPVNKEDDEEMYRNQQRFFEWLRNTPYVTLKLGRLAKHGTTFVEKGVDIALAVDMIRLARNNVYDTAILISEDGDFVPAVEEVQEHGKHVENAFPRKARFLPAQCDRFILLDKPKLKDCFLKRKPWHK